ncbi:MAG: HEAT repeat domain-containing protein [Planctomycetota bacterium]
MTDDVEVQFCDLCGTSVPLVDLERGAAIRHQAKTIGACCLQVLKQGDSPLVSPGLPEAPPAAPAVQRPVAATGGDRGVLRAAVITLVAIAAVALYLDYRIAGVVRDQEAMDHRLTNALQGSSDVLERLDQQMDGAARRADVDAVREKLVAIDATVAAQHQQQAKTADDFAQALTAVQGQVKGLHDSAIDYRPLFDSLREQLNRQLAAIGDIRAMAAAPSRVEPAPAAPAPEVPVATDPGLPPELAAQIARLADADAAVRFEAVDQLLVSKNLAVLPQLVPMTRDADGFVRRLAVEGLRDFKHEDAVNALIEALGDADQNVADTAWGSLKKLTGQKIPFEASAPKEARARQQLRWREWWDKNKGTFAS